MQQKESDYNDVIYQGLNSSEADIGTGGIEPRNIATADGGQNLH